MKPKTQQVFVYIAQISLTKKKTTECPKASNYPFKYDVVYFAFLFYTHIIIFLYSCVCVCVLFPKGTGNLGLFGLVCMTQPADLMLLSCKLGAPSMLFSQAKRWRGPPFTSATNPRPRQMHCDSCTSWFWRLQCTESLAESLPINEASERVRLSRAFSSSIRTSSRCHSTNVAAASHTVLTFLFADHSDSKRHPFFFLSFSMTHDRIQMTPHAMHSASLQCLEFDSPTSGGVKIFTYPSTYLWHAHI